MADRLAIFHNKMLEYPTVLLKARLVPLLLVKGVLSGPGQS